MRTETSAGGVVVRREDTGWEVVLTSRRTRRGDLAWGLPKGLVEPGERAEDTAVREVQEETGLVAVIRSPSVALEGLAPGMHPLVVVVEALEKPGNLGAIMRTADAVGASAVIAADPRTDVFNPNAIRQLLHDHFHGGRDHSARIWRLLMLELWHRNFLDTFSTHNFSQQLDHAILLRGEIG